MSTVLAVCPGCSRHVKAIEVMCPFCGTVVTREMRASADAASRIGTRGLSRSALVLAAAAAINTAACGKATKPTDPGPPNDNGTIAAAYGAPAPTLPPQTPIAWPVCKARRAPPGTETEYTCPDPAASAKCAASDVTACTPSGRTRGAVAPGGKCVHPTANPAEAAKLELGDDCAPHPSTTSASSPKGSYCVMESGPGAYCTHECKTTADCADLHRDNFAATCSGTLCLLSKR
jgi:hypothetical protein